MKAILIENDGLASDDIYQWVESIVDKNYEEISPNTDYYRRSDDLHWFVKLINPKLEKIFVSSSFIREAPFECRLSFYGEKGLDYEMLQVEYFSWLIRQAVFYRRKNNITPLELHINYHNGNLFDALNKLEFGEKTSSNILLTIRQAGGYLTVYCYEDYKLVGIIQESNENYVYIKQ